MTSRKMVTLIAMPQILSLNSTRVAGMMVKKHSIIIQAIILHDFYYIFVTIIL